MTLLLLLGRVDRTWAGNPSTVEVEATPAAFNPGPVTWAGVTATTFIDADNGTFTVDATSWTGTDTTILVVATTATFVGDAVATWSSSSTPNLEVEPQPGAFIRRPRHRPTTDVVLLGRRKPTPVLTLREARLRRYTGGR